MKKPSLNIIKDLLMHSIEAFSKAVFASMKDKVDEQLEPLIRLKKNTDELMNDLSITGFIKFFYKLFTENTSYKNSAMSAGKAAGEAADNFINKKIDEIKRQLMKKLAKIIYKIMKVVFKAVIKLLSSIWAILCPWGFVAILVVILIYWAIMLLPSLTNLFSFSYGFNKAEYYDTELFQAVKNKETMLENIYERTAETSFYQRFADSEIDDFLGLLVPNMEKEMTEKGKTYKEAAQEAQAGFTGFYTMDQRETAHDANFNPMQDIIQANTIDTSNENSATMQGYFRDLFDKEVNFMLSEQFLRQANAYVQDLGVNYNNQLVYPEMFVKPIAYVTDFNRIDLFTEIKDNQLQYVWKDYTYTTKRVLKEDIGKNLGSIVRNINELDWASYYGAGVSSGTSITESMEGQIASWPSPYVWEYAVYKKDFYKIYDDGTDTAVYNSRDDFVDNDYNNEYLTFVNDETGETEQVRLFYKITGADGGGWNVKLETTKLKIAEGTAMKKILDFFGKVFSDGEGNPFTVSKETNAVTSYGLLGDEENYIYGGEEPEVYIGVLDDTFSSSINTNPLQFFDRVSTSGDGVWYIIPIPEGYRLPKDVPATYIDEDGNKHFQSREINEVKIRKIFNPGPKKHVQTVQLTDNNGNLAVSSQNLINYKYYKVKTVSEAYRNREEYVEGWDTYISNNTEILGNFSNRNLATRIAARITAVQKTVGNAILDAFKSYEQTDLANYNVNENPGVNDDEVKTLTTTEQNDAALYNFIMDFPQETLALSLYLYEKELVETSPENEVWKWDYSVNNYFKTDNKKMDGFEMYQKYYYIFEEATLSNSFGGGTFKEEAELLLKEYNANKSWYQGNVGYDTFNNAVINTITGQGKLNIYGDTEDNLTRLNTKIVELGSSLFNGINFFEKITSKIDYLYMVTLGKEIKKGDIVDLLDKMSSRMSTQYVNLGTIRKSKTADGTDSEMRGFYNYIPNYNSITSTEKQFVIGTDISGNNRGGEGSLLSTFYVNENLRDLALIYSARNKGDGTLVEYNTPVTTSIKFEKELSKIQESWNSVKSFFTGEEFVSTGGGDIPITINPEEHNHYQYEYYIDTSSISSSSSGVFDSSGNGRTNELPLEVQSVRDYGLGSILNYVDSLTVEFYSGAWYDEVYLKDEIGTSIITAYPNIYSTYSYLNKSLFKYENGNANIKENASERDNESLKNSASIVGSGYYPKEMKELASDSIVELFEQNGKKNLFEQLVNAIDSKIYEVSDDYDEALWNEEKNNILKIDDKEFDLTDISSLDTELKEIDFKVHVTTDSMIGQAVKFTLKDADGNPIGFNSSLEGNSINWTDYQIYRISQNDSKFYYYMPEILYKEDTAPSKITQLLIPKRYYRSWVKSLSAIDDNGEEWNEKVKEMNQLELLRTLILKKTVLVNKKSEKFLKTYDATLPKTNLDAVIKGMADKTSDTSLLPYELVEGTIDIGSYSTGEDGTYNIYGGRYEHENISEENLKNQALNAWQITLLNNDTRRILMNSSKVSSNIYKYDAENNIVLDDEGNPIVEKTVDQWYTEGGELTDIKPGPTDKLYDWEGKEIKTSGQGGEKAYLEYLLDTYSSDNFKGCINRFDFITDNDVSKVFVIDEAATFTGKFMYTYKDTLLSTGDILDLENTKGVLSAYSTDRYVFLDSWDIKLLTERVVDISFALMNIQPTINDLTISQYIDEKNNELKELPESITTLPPNSLSDDSLNKISELLENILDGFSEKLGNHFEAKSYDDFYDNLYVYAIPSDMVNSFGSGNWDASTRNEIEEYSRIIFSGFLFQTKKPGDISTGDSYKDSSGRGDWKTKFNLLNKNDAYILEDTRDVEDQLSLLLQDLGNSLGGASLAPGKDVETYPQQSIDSETLKTYLEEHLNKIITGFNINDSEYSFGMKLNTENIQNLHHDGLSGFADYSGIINRYIDSIQNQFMKVLNKKHIKDFSFEGFDYNYSLKNLKGEYNQESNGKTKCVGTVYTYSIKCSDEIATRVENGRYYSLLSKLSKGNIRNISETTGDVSGLHNSNFKAFENWSSQNLQSSDFGELFLLDAETLSEIFKDVYKERIEENGNTSGKIEVDIKYGDQERTLKINYNDLWKPQVKLFDNIENIKYLKSSMKETLYGVYFNGGKANLSVNVQSGVLNSSNELESNLNLKRVVHDLTGTKNKDFFKIFAGMYDSEDSSSTTSGNRNFLKNAFDNVSDSGTFNNVLGGFSLEEKVYTNLFSPDEDFSKEENMFEDKEQDVFLIDDNQVYAINPIEVLRQDQKNELIKILNDEYGDKISEIIRDNAGEISVPSSEKFAITGFSLVPRFADRRDEPTFYPIYRYYGGSKKQIIPEEQIKYFEGLTYNSWKAKMTIGENDDDEKKLSFKEEMHRLSNYIYSYFQNFESYVPYNVIVDSDLEIRGTAGYADLLTQYTLYPIRTINYTNEFVSEAGKAYWDDLCTAYDIPRTVIAQLLQGIAETKLSTFAEDNVALMVSRGDLPSYDESYIAEINSKLQFDNILGFLDSNSKTDRENANIAVLQEALTIEGKTLPILGICAIDDIPDADIRSSSDEDFTEETASGTNTMGSLTFIGSAKGASGFADSSRNRYEKASSDEELISLIDTIPEGTKKIAFMPSIADITGTITETGDVDTVWARNFLYKLHKKFPDAELYYFPINPVVANSTDDGNINFDNSYASGLASPFNNPYTINEAINTFNYRMRDFANECLDGSVEYIDYLSAVAGDNGVTLNSDYADSDKHSLNSAGWAAMRSYVDELFAIEHDEQSFGEKDTKYFSPVGENIKEFEVSLNITNDLNDDRLNIRKSIQYMSVKLYKNSKNLGDLLKGVYASFYGEKFVKALIAVTDDNSMNLAIDNQHGLWYRPTSRDIERAIERLNSNVTKLFDWREELPHDELTEIYGIDKLQNAFSYIKDLDLRKILVTYSMNSGGGSGNLQGINIGDLEGWDIGVPNKVAAAKKAAEQKISGTSLFGGNVNGVSMIEYITAVCSQFSTEKSPLDPALVLAMIMQESGGNPNIKQKSGVGLGLAQHSVPGGLSASATTADGVRKSINFPYSRATDPIASIDYIVVNFAGSLQSASYEMHPFTALKAHNLPTTKSTRQESQFLSKYPLTPEGDLAYIYDYETGNNYEGFHKTMVNSGSGAKRAAAASESEYKAAIASNKNFGYSDPKYITHILGFYVEEYANGDLFNTNLNASNKRDYSDEIWEEEYLKYQNTGVELISAYLPASDIDILVQMTANYRNNNNEENEYGYTYLDFFKDVDKRSSGENEFTGEMGDSLVLNAMTYLGAHYSQGLASRPQDFVAGHLYPRLSNGENLGGNVYDTPYGKIYEEGTVYSGDKYAFDCSSFGGQMYLAMGYNVHGTTCSTIEAALRGDPEVYLGSVQQVGTENLRAGDLLISDTHTIIWVGQTYTANYNNLFNPNTLRVYGKQIIKRSGTEVLAWANANVKENAYIHAGGYKPGGSCVNLKSGNASYLNRFRVYRFFRDDIDYNRASLVSVSENLCPTIFTSTTIKNNPYLIEYLENSGMLESEMAKGKFTAEDVALAKHKIAEVRGELTDGETDEDGDGWLTEEDALKDANKKDLGYYY